MTMSIPKTLVPLFSILFAVRLTAAGHDVSTSPATTPQLLPVLTANEREFIAAWVEPATFKNALLAGRIDHNSQPLDNAGIPVSDDTTGRPDVARGNSEALLAWSGTTGILAARITPAGVLLDPIPIAISKESHGAPVAVTWDGSRYFVIWTDDHQQLTGAFVAPDGSVTTPKIFLTPAAGDHIFEPDVAWDGGQYIVTYATGFDASTICSACTAFPDTVHVVGVSTAGVAITAPIRIAGNHTHMHVASSGAGILLVLDMEHDVSTIQAADDNGVLRLGDETPLFHWFGPVLSNIVWDGSAYQIAYRFFSRTDGPSWVGTNRIGDSGTSFEKRWMNAQVVRSTFYGWSAPSLATNILGESAFVISEFAPGSSVPRARFYFQHETRVWHGSPASPHDAVSTFNGQTATIEWQSGGDPSFGPFSAGPAQGYLIETSLDSGNTWTTAYATLPDELTWTTQASAGQQFRISAFSGGGISFPGAATTIHSEPRRRAVHR
jgi:hypothetical protein